MYNTYDSFNVLQLLFRSKQISKEMKIFHEFGYKGIYYYDYKAYISSDIKSYIIMIIKPIFNTNTTQRNSIMQRRKI